MIGPGGLLKAEVQEIYSAPENSSSKFLLYMCTQEIIITRVLNKFKIYRTDIKYVLLPSTMLCIDLVT